MRLGDGTSSPNFGHFEPEDRDYDERQALAFALGFTHSDLTHNQSGRLSRRQQIKLLWPVAKTIAMLSLSVVPALACIALLAAPALFGPKLAQFAFAGSVFHFRYILFIYGLATTLGLLLYHLAGLLGRDVLAIARLVRLIRDLATGQVACYTGRVTPNRSKDLDPLLPGGPIRFYFCVADRKYEVTGHAYDFLRLQDHTAWLTLYFTPRSHYLVAAEPVRSIVAVDTTTDTPQPHRNNVEQVLN